MADPAHDPATPFAGLDPDRIVDAVEALGFDCDGRILALNSYENRVYRVGLEAESPLVAKFYRSGRWSDEAILEEHAFTAELRAAELSVVAPLSIDGRTLHHDDDLRFALFPLQPGRAPEPGDREVLKQIGRSLGRLHAIGAAGRFRHRGSLTVESHGIEPVQYLLDADWLPPTLEENFTEIAHQLLDAVEDAWPRFGEIALLRLHGDCHPGNLLWREGAPHFVDLDDTLTGPAMQDLWMLLSGDAQARRRQLAWLLEGYETFRPFDRRELSLIEPLRTLRLLHYHAWIARRWHDPAFPAAFPWFESPRHWESVLTQLQEQLSTLREPPISVP